MRLVINGHRRLNHILASNNVTSESRMSYAHYRHIKSQLSCPAIRKDNESAVSNFQRTYVRVTRDFSRDTLVCIIIIYENYG